MPKLLVACLVLFVSSCAFAAPDDQGQYQIISSVMLMRHGLRSPTKSNAKLAEYSKQEWPQWSVAPGELTARGVTLVEHMGQYLRQLYEDQKLFENSTCPNDDEVLIWSDNADQRTLESGRALIKGIAPGCSISSHSKPQQEGDDPIFHSVGPNLCVMNPVRARDSILAQAHGDLAAEMALHAQSMRRLQEILGYQGSELCKGAMASCGLDQMATEIAGDKSGEGSKFKGALPIASTVTEIFLLEYGENLPDSQVAWGKLGTFSAMDDMLSLHNLQSRLLGRAPYIASVRGTPLAKSMLDALHSAHAKASHNQAARKLTAMVGHDTNLNSLAGMLGVDWTLPGQPDQTAPAATMAFELLRRKQDYFVRVLMMAPSLTQLRSLDSLNANNAPVVVPLAIPACGHNMLCPLQDFTRILEQSFDQDCLRHLTHPITTTSEHK